MLLMRLCAGYGITSPVINVLTSHLIQDLSPRHYDGSRVTLVKKARIERVQNAYDTHIRDIR